MWPRGPAIRIRAHGPKNNQTPLHKPDNDTPYTRIHWPSHAAIAVAHHLGENFFFL